jgi:hypothetical protein
MNKMTHLKRGDSMEVISLKSGRKFTHRMLVDSENNWYYEKLDNRYNQVEFKKMKDKKQAEDYFSRYFN